MYYEAITKRSSRTDTDEVGHFSSFKKNRYKNRKTPSFIKSTSARFFAFIILDNSPNITLKLNIIYLHFRNEKSKVQIDNEVCPS